LHNLFKQAEGETQESETRFAARMTTRATFFSPENS